MALDTGYERPTLAELIERAEDDLSTLLETEDARLPHSEPWVLAHVLAMAVHCAHGHAAAVAEQILPDTATVDTLERHAGIWGLSRNPATYAQLEFRFSGVDGTMIPAGTAISNADGSATWETDAVDTVGGVGWVEIYCTATEPGTDGNLAAAGKAWLDSPIAGIDALATVVTVITTAVAEESDDDLRARVLSRIQTPAGGGSSADYERWAQTVSQVDRVWVTSHEMGAASCTVRFTLKVAAGGAAADAIPAAGDIAEVDAVLQALRPVTAEVWTVGITADPIDFTILVYPDTAAIRAAVEEELNALFMRAGSPLGATIYRSQWDEAISAAAGEEWHAATAPLGDIVTVLGDFPTLGTITWV